MTHVDVIANGSRPSAKGPAQTSGERRQIQPGDVVRIPPDTRHWHGATATTRMSHIAITNVLNGKMVDWQEHVSDAEYNPHA